MDAGGTMSPGWTAEQHGSEDRTSHRRNADPSDSGSLTGLVPTRLDATQPLPAAFKILIRVCSVSPRSLTSCGLEFNRRR